MTCWRSCPLALSAGAVRWRCAPSPRRLLRSAASIRCHQLAVISSQSLPRRPKNYDIMSLGRSPSARSHIGSLFRLVVTGCRDQLAVISQSSARSHRLAVIGSQSSARSHQLTPPRISSVGAPTVDQASHRSSASLRKQPSTCGPRGRAKGGRGATVYHRLQMAIGLANGKALRQNSVPVALPKGRRWADRP